MAKTKKKAKVRGLSLFQQYLIGFLVLVLAVAGSALYFITLAITPFEQAETRAVELAKEYAQLTEVEQVAIYNGAESYDSLLGKQADGQSVAVLIPKDDAAILVYPLANGLSQQEAERIAQENGAQTIERVVFGYADDHPIWEVKSGTAYYLISFETGELLKKEGL